MYLLYKNDIRVLSKNKHTKVIICNFNSFLYEKLFRSPLYNILRLT